MNPTDPILRMMPHAKPFVKWAGGKSKLIPQLEAAFPPQIYTDPSITYIEPFVGGGAMLFHLLMDEHVRFSRIVINDINADLMNCYRTIKDSPQDLLKELRRIEQLHWHMHTETGKSELFYAHRDRYNSKLCTSECERAALFLYLNHTCFNGLYRVNVDGAFNVPYGKRKKPVICNEERILADSEWLNSADITMLTGDYTQVESYVNDGHTFMYIDPPYKPLNSTSNFKEYSNAPFNDKEQEALKEFCDRVTSKGAALMLSNSDARDEAGDSYFKKLYEGYHCRHVYAPRSINPQAHVRKHLPEILITNYPHHGKEDYDSSQQP